jgi:hypothetical protein
MQQILKAYLKRLTDLTAANKSLLLLQLPAEQFVDLHDFDFLNGKPSFDVVAGLLAGKPAVPLCDVLDSRYDRVNEASRRLQKISRTAAFIAAERGTQDLYAGYPTVRGKLADGTPVRCPLLFFPRGPRPQGQRLDAAAPGRGGRRLQQDLPAGLRVLQRRKSGRRLAGNVFRRLQFRPAGVPHAALRKAEGKPAGTQLQPGLLHRQAPSLRKIHAGRL